MRVALVIEYISVLSSSAFVYSVVERARGNIFFRLLHSLVNPQLSVIGIYSDEPSKQAPVLEDPPASRFKSMIKPLPEKKKE